MVCGQTTSTTTSTSALQRRRHLRRRHGRGLQRCYADIHDGVYGGVFNEVRGHVLRADAVSMSLISRRGRELRVVNHSLLHGSGGSITAAHVDGVWGSSRQQWSRRADLTSQGRRPTQHQHRHATSTHPPTPASSTTPACSQGIFQAAVVERRRPHFAG